MQLRKTLANFSISLIKQLRQESGSPINDCKKALEHSGNDFEKAMTYLKERGLAQADKRAGKLAKQGVIVALTNHKVASLVEINCETDFVARTSEFLTFSEEFVKFLVSQRHALGKEDVEDLLKKQCQSPYFTTNVDDKRKELIGKLQENILIGQLHTIVAEQNSLFGVYNHNCLKNTICGLGGSVVELISDKEISDVGAQVMREGASNLAVTYLGMKPRFIHKQQVDEAALDEVRQMIKKENSNKSEKQLEFILKGKLQKHYEENVFEEMEYILDEQGLSIKEYIKNELESVTKSKIHIGRCLSLVI